MSQQHVMCIWYVLAPLLCPCTGDSYGAWQSPKDCWLVGCLTSQQQASVSQGRICSDNFTYCHTEIEVADQTFCLTQSQVTDTGPTSPSADPMTPGAWQGSHWSANFEVSGMTRSGKIPSQAGFEPRIFRSRGGQLNHYAIEVVRIPKEHQCVCSAGGVFYECLDVCLTAAAEYLFKI